MKKILIVSFALILGVVSGFVLNIDTQESLERNIQKAIPYQSSQKTIDSAVILNHPLIAHQQKKKVTQKDIQDLLQCIENETCFRKESRFFDDKTHPVFAKLTARLDSMSLSGDENDLNEKILINLARFKHQELFYKAAEILLNRNIDYQGSEIPLLTQFFRAKNLSSDLRVFRNQKLSDFIQMDNFSFLTTLKEMHSISFSTSELKQLVGEACQRLEKIEKFKPVYKKQILNLNRKYGLPNGC